MKVTPISGEDADKNAAKFGPWKSGAYDFEVALAADDKSKSGNDMIALTVRIYNTDGDHRTVFDYLVSTDGMAYKVRHFAESVGLLSKYEGGEFDAADCEGRTGRCKVSIEPAKDGYPAKNKITDYIKARTSGSAGLKREIAALKRELDDDIPF